MELVKITDLFGIRESDAVKNGSGEVIEFAKLPDRTDGTEKYIPKRKSNYVFDTSELIDIGIALDRNKPLLIWGLHGSGKSTVIMQFANRVNRPAMRVQHSVSTEEADVLGTWVLEGDKTTFHLGPLARAMKYGLIYVADEYDFALPNVLAIYQAVLEGEPLLIKNAPEDIAVIEPHPDFRFVATGNTNGSGDETGLYQGTQLQNAANYSRFAITIHKPYPKNEAKILTETFGKIPEVDLKSVMSFVTAVRKAYDERTITNTLSTRELLEIVDLAILRGRDKLNFKYGVQKAFTARMSSIDAAAINSIADRIFE